MCALDVCACGRYEKSGALAGLFRVRGFTQDDAHIFCLPEQLADEITDVLDLFENVLSRFGFSEYEVMLSTRPDKSVGSDEIWERATGALVQALDNKNWAYSVDEGGGAFYGPKIDVKIKDAIGRMWQCSTVQCDFNLPERFGLEYVAASGAREQPIMVHRAIFGSIERFFGVLTESTAGDFPFWLAPVQLRLLPVSDDFRPYCEEALAAYPSLKATIIAPATGVSLSSDGDWVSARPQDLEGELVAPVALGDEGEGSLDVQDLAEVAIQASLRLSRDVERRTIRVVSSGGAAATRQNENYFTSLGGENAKKREGDVTSVDWTATFSVLEEDVEVLKSPEEEDWAAGTYR